MFEGHVSLEVCLETRSIRAEAAGERGNFATVVTLMMVQGGLQVVGLAAFTSELFGGSWISSCKKNGKFKLFCTNKIQIEKRKLKNKEFRISNYMCKIIENFVKGIEVDKDFKWRDGVEHKSRWRQGSPDRQ